MVWFYLVWFGLVCSGVWAVSRRCGVVVLVDEGVGTYVNGCS